MNASADHVADASLRRLLATSEAPAIRRLRGLRKRVRTFTLPAPRVVVRPALAAFVAIRTVWHYAFRLLICEPLFKAHCRSYGRGVRTDVFIHWITGRGDIIIGDDVLVDGKCSITFASRYAAAPSLIVGDHTGIGHGCTFSIGKRITIGRHCRIAAHVWMFDSSGHPADPQARLAGLPAAADEVKPITIGDNVWIGGRAIVHPGVTIGANSVIAAGAVVTGDVPPCTIVAGNPARKVGQLPMPENDTDERSGRDSVR